jgi:hypothetical protein
MTEEQKARYKERLELCKRAVSRPDHRRPERPENHFGHPGIYGQSL